MDPCPHGPAAVPEVQQGSPVVAWAQKGAQGAAAVAQTQKGTQGPAAVALSQQGAQGVVVMTGDQEGTQAPATLPRAQQCPVWAKGPVQEYPTGPAALT